MSITIHGASDDLIEIEGDIREEFNWTSNDPEEKRVLAFSDGTLLSVKYDENGIWRLNKLVGGKATFSKIEGDYETDANDQVTLSGVVITWIMFGEQYSIQKKRG